MAVMFHHVLRLVLSVCLMAPVAVAAHEFWIEPTAHVLAPGDTIEANLKVGQDYSGRPYPYLPGRFVRFVIRDRTGTRDVDSIAGDLPAVRIDGAAAGLHILAYDSQADRLTFDDWDSFVSYVAYEGNDWAVQAHLDAGLPQSGISEAYRRHAKALVQAGPAGPDDQDRALGLPLELVARSSPFAPAPGGLSVQLLWQGKPLAGQRINIFRMADGRPGPQGVTTDADGYAVVPVTTSGRYLLNAVHMVLNGADAEYLWDSYWASLTFEVPGGD